MTRVICQNNSVGCGRLLGCPGRVSLVIVQFVACDTAVAALNFDMLSPQNLLLIVLAAFHLRYKVVHDQSTLGGSIVFFLGRALVIP